MPLKVIVQHVQNGVDATAWISAVAAVVQAVGAVAAIWYSGKLARDAAAREIAADAAATRRMKEADEAAAKRAEAAERAAEERARALKNEAYNDLIERVTSLGILAADDCNAQIQVEKGYYLKNTASVTGSFVNRHIAELRDRLPLLKAETVDVELMEAIAELQEAIEPRSFRGNTGAAYLEIMRSEVDKIYNCLNAIERLRR
jgi:hypothetical protein